MTGEVKEFRSVSDHAEDVEDGRLVPPGETFKLSGEQLKSDYNKAKIDDGKFVEIEEPTQEPPPFDRDAALAEAKELGITGYTKMRNDELQTAINHAKEQKGGGS